MEIEKKKKYLDSKLLWLLTFPILLFYLFKTVEFNPWVFFDEKSSDLTLSFLGTFFPPEISADFIFLILDATIQTISIATAGLFLAVILGILGALIICYRLSFSYIDHTTSLTSNLIRSLLKTLLIVFRSVPELVWALIFVRIVGLGPTAGVIAIALTYGGMLGKVYAEILESGDEIYTKNLYSNGTGKFQVLFFGLIPQNILELLSYTIYRWECAIRSTVVLGFVGAGGLGQQLDNSMKMFKGNEVCTIIIVFILLVFFTDWISKWLRKKII